MKINLHTTHELSNTRQELTSTFSKLCTRSPLEKENREKRRRILMEDKIMRSLPKTQKIIGFLSIPAKFESKDVTKHFNVAFKINTFSR